VKTEPDAVTILHQDGGALVPLANLPPDLQKHFNYDPDKAKAAAEARVKDNAENAKALQAEMDEASAMRQAGPEPEESQVSDTEADSMDSYECTSNTPTNTYTHHHSMDELSARTRSLQNDTSDSTHHSMGELAPLTQSLRRDLSDPTYHTMAHLSLSMHSLASDSSDPTHHSMDSIP
jgi:hypothetical protein